jgi:hypothetical protein
MLRQVAGLLNEYANLLLAVITAIYAFFTYRMAKLMSQQTMAKIEVAKIIAGTPFLEDHFKTALNDGRVAQYRHTFKIIVHLTNRGAGNGSIDKPSLVLHFLNGQRVITPPEIKEWPFVSGGLSPLQAAFLKPDDLGGTIFLPGGDRQRHELKYQVLLDESIAAALKKGADDVKYYAAFNDNLNRSYLTQITDIRPLEGFEHLF